VPPGLKAHVAALLHSDARLSAELAVLQRLFRGTPADRAVLVHGDILSGNVLCHAEATHVIDFETASYGPCSYGVGHLMGNIMKRALGARAHAEMRREQQEAWLADSVVQLWDAYWAERRVVGAGAGMGISADDQGSHLADALGYAGVAVICWQVRPAAPGSQSTANVGWPGLALTSWPDLICWQVGAFNILEVIPRQRAAHGRRAPCRAVVLGAALLRHKRRVP
jgi:hypothetical protein